MIFSISAIAASASVPSWRPTVTVAVYRSTAEPVTPATVSTAPQTWLAQPPQSIPSTLASTMFWLALFGAVLVVTPDSDQPV